MKYLLLLIYFDLWQSVNSFQTSLKVSYKTQLFQTLTVGPPLQINEDYKGLKRIHKNPDVYVIENFLDKASCSDMIKCAKEKRLELSPVAYAGCFRKSNSEFLSSYIKSF